MPLQTFSQGVLDDPHDYGQVRQTSAPGKIMRELIQDSKIMNIKDYN